MVVTNTSQRINPKKRSLKPYVLRVWDCITSIFARKLDRGFKETLQKKSPLGSLEEKFYYHMISVNPIRLTNTKTLLLKLRESTTLCFCCLFLSLISQKKLRKPQKVIFNTTKGKI